MMENKTVCKDKNTAILILQTVAETLKSETQQDALEAVAQWVQQNCFDDDITMQTPEERDARIEELQRLMFPYPGEYEAYKDFTERWEQAEHAEVCRESDERIQRAILLGKLDRGQISLEYFNRQIAKMGSVDDKMSDDLPEEKGVSSSYPLSDTEPGGESDSLPCELPASPEPAEAAAMIEDTGAAWTPAGIGARNPSHKTGVGICRNSLPCKEKQETNNSNNY